MRRRAFIVPVAVGVMAAFPVGPALATDGSVEASTTGDRSELLETIPVESGQGTFRSVMRLAPQAMPAFKAGDRLRVSAELVVTTDCTRPAPRCTGRPYTFDPRVETRIVLASASGDAVVAEDRMTCVQQPGDRQHHCVIPHHGIEAHEAADRLGCDGGGCKLEMQIRARNPHAGPGHLLIIGGQDESGRLRQDKGRLNAIRLRGLPRTRVVAGGLSRTEVPPDLEKRVVLSERIDGLRRGDVIEASVDLRASVAHLPYPALVGSQIVLAESPGATHGKRFVSRVANLRGELTEGGGSNCTQSQTPCPVFRTGMLKIRESSVTPRGENVPLFLNLVVRANNKLKPERPGDMIRLIDRGGLKAKIYRGS
jgi:hypothetical protein